MIDFLKYKPPKIAMLLVLVTTIPSLFFLKIINYPLNLLGILIVLLGFGIMMWAWSMFRKVDNAICPTAKTSKIITNGAYNISRNPMYLGMVIMLVGFSVIIGSIIAFFSPILFFLIINKVFIPYEEEKLRKNIGTEYNDYCEGVRRWI